MLETLAERSLKVNGSISHNLIMNFTRCIKSEKFYAFIKNALFTHFL